MIMRNTQIIPSSLTLSRRRSVSYRNQSTTFVMKELMYCNRYGVIDILIKTIKKKRSVSGLLLNVNNSLCSVHNISDIRDQCINQLTLASSSPESTTKNENSVVFFIIPREISLYKRHYLVQKNCQNEVLQMTKWCQIILQSQQGKCQIYLLPQIYVKTESYQARLW